MMALEQAIQSIAAVEEESIYVAGPWLLRW